MYRPGDGVGSVVSGDSNGDRRRAALHAGHRGHVHRRRSKARLNDGEHQDEKRRAEHDCERQGTPVAPNNHHNQARDQNHAERDCGSPPCVGVTGG